VRDNLSSSWLTIRQAWRSHMPKTPAELHEDEALNRTLKMPPKPFTPEKDTPKASRKPPKIRIEKPPKIRS
jgi:hypothetical protein